METPQRVIFSSRFFSTEFHHLLLTETSFLRVFFFLSVTAAPGEQELPVSGRCFTSSHHLFTRQPGACPPSRDAAGGETPGRGVPPPGARPGVPQRCGARGGGCREGPSPRPRGWGEPGCSFAVLAAGAAAAAPGGLPPPPRAGTAKAGGRRGPR